MSETPLNDQAGTEPTENDEEVTIDFPEATDCDVDDSKTSREDGDK